MFQILRKPLFFVFLSIFIAAAASAPYVHVARTADQAITEARSATEGLFSRGVYSSLRFCLDALEASGHHRTLAQKLVSRPGSLRPQPDSDISVLAGAYLDFCRTPSVADSQRIIIRA